MSGCAVGIQRLDPTCAGCSQGLEAGQGAGHLSSSTPDPHRSHLYLAWHLLAVSLHPGTLGDAGSVIPLALCHLGLALLLRGDSVSWIRACLRWALPPWAPELPLPVMPISAHVQIFAIPFLSTSCSPRIPPLRLWSGPFPPGGRRQLPVHGSKWRH